MSTNFILLLSSSAESSSATAQGGNIWSSLLTFIPFILIFVAMYFLMIRPQKKRQKEEQQMRNNVRVGDMITTIGGICGRVINIKEDELVIETGADRSKMTIRKWALQTVDTVHDTPAVDDDDDDDI